VNIVLFYNYLYNLLSHTHIYLSDVTYSHCGTEYKTGLDVHNSTVTCNIQQNYYDCVSWEGIDTVRHTILFIYMWFLTMFTRHTFIFLKDCSRLCLWWRYARMIYFTTYDNSRISKRIIVYVRLASYILYT